MTHIYSRYATQISIKLLVVLFGFCCASINAQGYIGVGGHLSSQENCHNYFIKTGYLHQAYPQGLPENGEGYDAMENRVKNEVPGSTDVLVYGYEKGEVAVIYEFEAQNPDGYKCNFSGFIVGIGKTLKEANDVALAKKNRIEGIYSYILEWNTPVDEGKVIQRIINYGKVTVKYTIVKTEINSVLLVEGTNTSNETIVVQLVDQKALVEPVNLSELRPMSSDFDEKNQKDHNNPNFILAPNETFKTKVFNPCITVKTSSTDSKESEFSLQDLKPYVIDVINWVGSKVSSEKEDAPKKKQTSVGAPHG